MISRERFIYVLHAIESNLIKVGISHDVTKRVASIQNACGCTLIVLHIAEPMLSATAQTVEKQCLSFGKRTFGEWMEYDSDVINKIELLLVSTCTIHVNEWSGAFLIDDLSRHRGYVANLDCCPLCSCEDMSDKGSSNKCMGCGARISTSDDGFGYEVRDGQSMHIFECYKPGGTER